MSTRKLIALSFDDGPNMITTPQVLDILEKHGVTATFFVIGSNIDDESEAMMKRAVSLGCEIENHSLTHRDMTKLSAEEITEEINSTTEKIVAAVGRTPEFFRPPFIYSNDVMYDNIPLTFICGVNSVDYDPTVDAQGRFDNVVNNVRDGDVILMHDLAHNDMTVEAIDRIIPKLKEDGFSFVTVSQIFREKNVTPRKGVTYTNVSD